MEVAHITGRRFPSQRQPRHIIFRVSSLHDKDTILRVQGQALRWKNYFFTEDLTKRDLQVKRSMRYEISEARKAGKRWEFRAGRLYVEGRYIPPSAVTVAQNNQVTDLQQQTQRNQQQQNPIPKQPFLQRPSNQRPSHQRPSHQGPSYQPVYDPRSRMRGQAHTNTPRRTNGFANRNLQPNPPARSQDPSSAVSNQVNTAQQHTVYAEIHHEPQHLQQSHPVQITNTSCQQLNYQPPQTQSLNHRQDNNQSPSHQPMFPQPNNNNHIYYSQPVNTTQIEPMTQSPSVQAIYHNVNQHQQIPTAMQ